MARKIFIFLVLSCAPLLARQRLQGNCELGNRTITVSGIPSAATTPVMRSYPSCTVTVYAVGTTNLSTIYADNAGTGKANPFTADNTGHWFFYADDGEYDVKFNAGGIPSPFTYGDYQLMDTMFTQPGAPAFSAGAVARLLKQKVAETVSVTDFGADSTGSVSATSAFASAIAAVATHGIVRVPAGNFKLTGSGTELILINRPVSLVCDPGSILTVDSTVGNTTDAIRIYNPGGGLTNSFIFQRIDGCYVTMNSGTPARNGLTIDGTTAPITRLTVSNNLFNQFNGYGLAVVNPTCADRFFTSVIGPNNVFYGGVNLDCAGDSVSVLANTMTGLGTGVRVNLESGSSELLIEGNNITSQGGAISLVRGNRVKILHNNIENPVANTSANAAMIDLDGTPGNPALNVEVIGNYLGADVVSGISGIRANWTDYASIDANTYTFAGGGAYGLTITANATNTIIGNANKPVSSPSSWVLDSAALTAQTSTYEGVQSGGGQRIGNRANFSGFTGTWASINGSDRRLLPGTTGSTIVIALDSVTGSFSGTPSVTTYNDVAYPVTITGGSVSSGVITLTSSAPHGMAISQTTPNTGYGYHTLQGNGTGGHNTAIGYNALATSYSGARDTAIGSAVLQLATASDNTGVGGLALSSLTTGASNTALGSQALSTDLTGSSNTAVGAQALQVVTGGTDTAVGASAGAGLTTGSNDAFFGQGAGFNATTGSFNTILGAGAGTVTNPLTTGSNNTFIGNGATGSLAAAAYQIVIGSGALGSGDHTITLGASADTLVVPGITNSAPASAGAAGVKGTIAVTSSYIYICVATNTWVRAAVATW